MTDIELVLNMLAEVTTTALSKSKKPETFRENVAVAEMVEALQKARERI